MDLQQLVLNKRVAEVEAIDARVEAYIASRNYRLQKRNGQRITTTAGEEEADEGDVPRGSEVFIGKLPKDMFEDELLPILERVGPVRTFRLMVDFTGLTRGYAFVTYFTVEHASAAVASLHGAEVRKGKNIGVYKSLDNCRLFIGGIPADKTKDDVRVALEEFITGIKDVVMYQSYEDKTKNRGFAFLVFENHRTAAMARRKLVPGSLILWQVPILVDWADPLPDVDPTVMEKVTKLYVRNLDTELSNECFHSIIAGFVGRETILKTHKIRDYAFVHFTNRSTAEEAFRILQGLTINGDKIEITWARPKFYAKKYMEATAAEHFCTSLPPRSRKQMAVRLTHKYPAIANKQLPPVPFAAAPTPPKTESPVLLRNPMATHASLMSPVAPAFQANNTVINYPISPIDYRLTQPPPVSYYNPSTTHFMELTSHFNSLSLS